MASFEHSIQNQLMESGMSRDLSKECPSNVDVISVHSRTSTRRGSQQWVGQIPTILRDIFRPSRNKIAHLNREMTTLSTILIDAPELVETAPTAVNTDAKHDVCLVSESPLYIVRVAGTGNVFEFERLIRDDLSKLKIANAAGLCAAHNAAARNRTAILALIVQYNGDLNIEDKNGWTPLHHAVRNNALNAIEFLLDNGVDDAHLNKQEEAPIHLAVIHNQLNALKFLLSKRPYQVNLPGERKQTPLHYAALVDNIDAATILTDNHARLCIRSDAGSYPIHVAALNSSNRVFNHLFETAKAIGSNTKSLLNTCDDENHKPLHLCVIGGNIEAVEICLENGSKIDDQQDDRSTPIHLAASQGSLELLRLMFTCQPELKSEVIQMTDIQGMTPLHKAAMGDHIDVLEFLLDLGSDIDARDLSKRTPLLLAALNSSLHAVCFLLSKNASVACQDEAERNLLHFTIMQNLPIDIIGNRLFKRDNFRMLFDQRDREGCYPIHYASREGQVNVLTTLIKHGAEINKKTNQRQSSLHFAAQYGRYNTCRQLLDTPGFKRIINEPDHFGCTPLHLCCQNGHNRVVQLLLHKGAQFSKSYNGNTPLHEAAVNGHLSTIHTILQAQPHLINAVNRLGMTSLHCAAAAGHAKCVDLLLSRSAEFTTNADGETFFDLAIMKKQKHVCLTIVAHDRWKEALDLGSEKYRRPLLGLIEHLPECVPVLFDRCISRSRGDRKHKDFHIIYDFHFINWTDVVDVSGKKYHYPMLPLNMMVKFGRTNHLSHPLCETLLRQKWLSYGFPVHMLNLGFYLLFIVAFSYFIITFPACNHYDRTPGNGGSHSCPNKNFVSFNKSATISQILCLWYIILYSVANCVFQVIHLVHDNGNYFSDIENYIQWIINISTILFAIPFLFNQSWHNQWVVGSVGIFTSYLGLLFLLGRFDLYGIYVIMFLEILKTLLHVLSLFSILIIGFALTFCVILPFREDLRPSNLYHLFIIILKSVTMMLGELNYDRVYLEGFDEQHFSITNFIMLLLFIVIMPILLMNLLVGLAIGDLMQIQQNARLKRLAMQVQLHTNLEKILPEKLMRRWTKNEAILYINKGICHRFLVGTEQCNAKPLNTNDLLHANDDSTSTNELTVEIHKQKQRQKDMQRQLDKITELVQLVVQKMEINTERMNEDRLKLDDTDEDQTMPKARQTSSIFRRIRRLRPPTSHDSSDAIKYTNL